MCAAFKFPEDSHYSEHMLGTHRGHAPETPKSTPCHCRVEQSFHGYASAELPGDAVAMDIETRKTFIPTFLICLWGEDTGRFRNKLYPSLLMAEHKEDGRNI